VEAFARDILKRPLFGWQRWLVIHSMELLSNGWPRFRQVLVMVGRQNGKTELLVILALFWLWVQEIPMVLGTSTKLDMARVSWKKAIRLAKATPELRNTVRVRNENGKEELANVIDRALDIEAMYKIAASNEEGGRSLTVHRLVEDELRQHKTYDAHDAAKNTMNAVDDAQAFAITNEGDDTAIVLHDLQESALLFLAQGEGDPRLGFFGYTAEPGCDLLDIEQTAQSNPSMGEKGGVSWANLVGEAKQAQLKGGKKEAGYRTEVLCQRVHRLRSMPVSLESWAATAKDAQPQGETWADDGIVPSFFVVVDEEQTSAVIASAVVLDGTPHVELAYADSAEGLTERAQELAKRYPVAQWAAPNIGLTRSYVPQFAAFYVDLKLFSAPEMASGCAHLQRLANQLAFTHSPNQAVVDALTGAEEDRLKGGAWTWSWEKSTSEIVPLVAETGALWLLESQPVHQVAFAFST
jgi:hypothetical protein